MASRRKARILAFQALYAWDASRMELPLLLSFSWLKEGSSMSMDEELKAFSSFIITGTLENITEIDNTISRHLDNWTIERLKRVELAILRMAVFCLLYQKDMPARITIDEAIEIAKEFGAEDSYRFVNGVLDAVWKSQENSTEA